MSADADPDPAGRPRARAGTPPRGSGAPRPAETVSFSGYHTLMRRRVRHILLVASPYDCFLLEADGPFSRQLYSQYLELNLSSPPRFSQVSSGREALRRLRRRRFDLVITTPHAAELSPRKLAAAIQERRPGLPVVMLTYDPLTAQRYAELPAESGFSDVFLWTGDPRLLLAIVKSVEDRLNAPSDTRRSAVGVIVVVEDSPAFMSAYLPIIFTEVLSQTQSLLGEGLTEADRLWRMRARPKILCARTAEAAEQLLVEYGEYLLGVVMDMGFPRGGRLDPAAGRALTQQLRAIAPDVPVLLQSAEPEHAAAAAELGVAFAHKQSPDLLATLRGFMHDHLGFGPLVFRGADGREVDRATDIQDLRRVIQTVPENALRWHAERNHISGWLRTRGEFALAAALRPWRLSDFPTLAEARARVVEALSAYLEDQQRGLVTEYARGADPRYRDFTRLGRGSMGGKARGIAFAVGKLATHPIQGRYPDVRVTVPRALVVCTEAFERACEHEGLRARALAAPDDGAVARLFLATPLPEELLADLAAILSAVREPLAVRSSSLYEDSAFAPLAGMYETVLLPNAAVDDRVRLAQLAAAIRLVWASTFYRGPRAYMAAAGLRHEEEKMAVVVQRIAGRTHGTRYYPDFAGVAQSRNFYPVGPQAADDGVATVALGLGHTVVDGGKALRFSPRHPGVVPQLASPAMAQRDSQREFRALDLAMAEAVIGPDTRTVRAYDLATAEADGTLAAVASTYEADNDRLNDTLEVPGPRVVTFAPVLKYDRFPLAPLLDELLAFGAEGLGTAVELEFAVTLPTDGRPAELAVVQLRPQVHEPLGEDVDVRTPRPGEVRLLAGRALGSGVIGGIRDVVYVHPTRFRPGQTAAAATEIGRINARLREVDRPYLLLAPGRWGTADPFLGIPVQWAQVSGARVVAELAVPGFRVDPSQGTHFFHNLTSLRIGYFTVDLSSGDGEADLDWLEAQRPVHDAAGVRHVTLREPLEVRLDHRSGRGIVVRRDSGR